MRILLFIFVFIFIIYSHVLGESDPSNNSAMVPDTTHIPIDLNGCIAQLDKIIPDSNKARIATMTEDQFSAGTHMNLGLWMRNNWGLWKGSQLSRFFNAKGIYHPDDMSGIILDSYYRYLIKKDIKLEEQIKYYQDYWEKVRGEDLERQKKEFAGYHIADTVLFNYRNGFSSKKQEDKYDNNLCVARGIITDRNEERFNIKVKLLDGCDKRGIVYYDSDGVLIYDSTTGKMEKPKKRIRYYMKVGKENWFNYSEWEVN